MATVVQRRCLAVNPNVFEAPELKQVEGLKIDDTPEPFLRYNPETEQDEWDGKNSIAKVLGDHIEKLQKYTSSVPRTVPTIDWAAWEKKVPKDEFEALKKGFENIEYEDAVKTAEELKVKADQIAKLEAEIQTQYDWQILRKRELEVELARLIYEHDHLDELTLHDLEARYPMWGERIEADIEEGVWPNIDRD